MDTKLSRSRDLSLRNSRILSDFPKFILSNPQLLYPSGPFRPLRLQSQLRSEPASFSQRNRDRKDTAGKSTALFPHSGKLFHDMRNLNFLRTVFQAQAALETGFRSMFDSGKPGDSPGLPTDPVLVISFYEKGNIQSGRTDRAAG